MENETVTVEEASRLTATPWETLRKRLRRQKAILLPDPDHGQRKRVRVTDLPAVAQKRFMETKVKESLAVIVKPAEAQALALKRPGPQAMLQFTPPSERQEAIERALAAVPKAKRSYVERWSGIVGDCVNGTYRKAVSELVGGRIVNSKDDYISWISENCKVSKREIYRKLSVYKAIKEDPSIEHENRFRAFAEQILPKDRPGRASIFEKPDNEWMEPWIRNMYLTQANYSIYQTWEALDGEIQSKQRAWGLAKVYDRPSLRQVRTLIVRMSLPETTLGRKGDKAYNDICSPYISRDPESLHSNDLWVTDQKQIDVRLRGAGEQLGRIWMVNFLDVRSSKVLGYAFGPVLSSDMVIMAAAMAIERYGVPGAIHMDLGKEFACTAFSGSFRKISGEAFFEPTQGLCQRLGIKVLKAIGRNPQSKTIERWHNVVSEFDKNFPGWCGRNTDERPEVLAELERQHEDWKQTGTGGSPLIGIYQYVYEYMKWVEGVWNAKKRGRGRYLQGMTPNECYNTRLPAEGVKRVTASELDFAVADHRVLKVARGGQVNLTFYGQTIEYQAPELFLHQGEEVEVIISRRGAHTLSKVTVLDKAENGRFLCEAHAKPLYHWLPENREDLRQAMRCKNAVKKAIKAGNAAQRLMEATISPAELAENEKPIREISSMEFTMRKLSKGRGGALAAPHTMTSGDLARRLKEMQEAEA